MFHRLLKHTLPIPGIALPCSVAHAATQRPIPTAMAESVCAAPQSLREQDFQKFGLYDSGVQLQVVSAVPDHLIHRIARKLASSSRHEGYAIHHCDGMDRFIILTFPSPVAFTENSVELKNALDAHCEHHEFRFALAKGKLSTVLQIHEKIPRHSGIVTLTCFPEDPTVGPITWFAIPTGNGPLPQPPIPVGDDLAEWANATRKSEGLPSLSKLEHFDKDASILLQNEQVFHQRDKMSALNERALQKHIALIGEDRVIADSVLEAATQIWNSPRHRDLILDAHAGKLLIVHKNLTNSSQSLYVFITAQ